MITYYKAWLFERTNSVTGKRQHVISTNKPRAVNILGGLDIKASYSEYEPGQKTIASKIRTLYLDDVTPEILTQMKQHAEGDVFYLGVPAGQTEAVACITPKDYEELQSSTSSSDSIPA